MNKKKKSRCRASPGWYTHGFSVREMYCWGGASHDVHLETHDFSINHLGTPSYLETRLVTLVDVSVVSKVADPGRLDKECGMSHAGPIGNRNPGIWYASARWCPMPKQENAGKTYPVPVTWIYWCLVYWHRSNLIKSRQLTSVMPLISFSNPILWLTSTSTLGY